MTVPELLSPAGGVRQLEAAVRFGADAVYLGLDQYSLRARARSFDLETLGEAVRYAHAHGVKVLLTLNIFPYDEDIGPMARVAREAHALGIDAVILSDPGALLAVREAAPDLEIHLSTQANTMNAAAARFWHSQGVRRIVLSRELSLERIKVMRDALPPTLELEAFVHGAVCMAYSGRCALSNYLAGRDANRGDCAQTCRWKYVLVEEKRPGQIITVEESEAFTEFFSAGDLCMIEHLPALAEAGLSALKIEGRMKNEYYVATVTGAYRRGLDALKEGRFTEDLARELKRELAMASHRRFDTGFYLGDPEIPGGAGGLTQEMEYVGRVIETQGQFAVVELKNRILVGDALELMTPGGIFTFRLDEIIDEAGESVASFGIPGARARLPVPHRCEPGDIIRGMCRNHRPAE